VTNKHLNLSPYKGLFLEVQSNPNAQAFYQNCGMTVIGKQQSASLAGRFLPVLAMPLSLRE